MSSVNISLKEEAYNFLKSLRGENESFSDVILGFKGKKGNKERVMNFFGVLKDKSDFVENEKRMKVFGKSFI